MVENRAGAPGSLWANTCVQGPASPLPVLILVQRVYTDLEFKGVLAGRENVGAFTTEEPKRRHLGRGQQASAKTHGEAHQPLSL